MKHLGFASIPAILQYLRYAETQGIDTRAAVRQAGIDPALLNNENGRITGEQFQTLIKTLLQTANDPLLGLHSSQYVQPGSYSVLGYILMSCATIGEAIQRIAPYEKLVGDMGVTSVEQHDHQIWITWHCAYPDPQVRQQMIDNVLASWTLYARWLANQQTSPDKILLEHPQPKTAELAEYQQIFACPVQFDAGRNSIVIRREILHQALRQPDKLLLKTLEQHALEQMSNLADEQLAFSIRVTNAIRNHLKQGVSRKDLIAQELGVTARTLQRRLVSEHSSYQQILDQVRLELASTMLSNPKLTIQDIAFNLGFADGRSFHRSFKNWTGLTPTDYRNQQLG